MRKRYIFARKRRNGQNRAMMVAIVALFGLAVWASLGSDPELPPIYLRAAPVDFAPQH
jgi:hypothetical protein